jgi:hypothetical protein
MAALLLPVVTATCAGHLPPCPAAGGPAWTELRSAHFRLRTDEKPADARATLTDLEQLRAALLTVFGASVDLDTGRLPVVVIDRGWTDFAPRQVNGFFTRALFQPLVVMAAGSQLHQQELIKHELVHFLTSKVMTRQPPWMAEGLASYYQTIEYDTETGRITVGRPPPDLLRQAQHRTSVASIEAMFTAGEIDQEARHFYADAWLTTHYLMNHRLEALARYENALRAGASPKSAWAAAFGAQTPEQLAVAVHQYLDRGQYALLIYRLPPLALPAPAERPLPEADIHATRALLFLTGSRARALVPELSLGPDDPRLGAKRELDEARRAEPGHVASLAIAQWMLDVPVSLEQATAASHKHGDDWLAWLLLADARDRSGDRAGQCEALARAAELADDDLSVEVPERASGD